MTGGSASQTAFPGAAWERDINLWQLPIRNKKNLEQVSATILDRN